MATIKKTIRTTVTKNVTPIHDPSPKQKGTGRNIRYEFATLEDAVSCLETGTFVLVSNVDVDKSIEKERIFASIQGKFSDGPLGGVHIGLKKNEVSVCDSYNSNKKHYKYEFLKFGDKNYDIRREREDLMSSWEKWCNFINVQLQIIAEALYPDTSVSKHAPIFVKLPEIVNPKSRLVSAVSERDTTETFDLKSFLGERGRIMIKLGLPWCMNYKEDSKLIGVSYSLDKFKYLTAEEEQEAKAEKEAEEKRKSILKKRQIVEDDVEIPEEEAEEEKPEVEIKKKPKTV